jgi:hypothetical protein
MRLYPHSFGLTVLCQFQGYLNQPLRAEKIQQLTCDHLVNTMPDMLRLEQLSLTDWT